jgi:hypothetical protein
MHTGLIARLDGTDAAAGGRNSASDHRILGRPRQVLVEIDQIVISDAGPPGAAGEDVPNCLIEAACDKPPLRQSISSDTPEKAHEVGIGADDRLETTQLLAFGRGPRVTFHVARGCRERSWALGMDVKVHGRAPPRCP